MKKLLLFASSFAFMATSMAQVVFSVESPESLQGSKDLEYAPAGNDWAAMTDLLDPNNAILDTLVIYRDDQAADSLGCFIAVNDDELAGKIAILYRGDCEFGQKALNAQDAGAIACVIINNQPGGPVGMAAGSVGADVTIPTVMISDVDGEAITNAMRQGEDVVVFIGNKTGFYPNDIGITRGSVIRAQSFGVHSLLAQDGDDFSVDMGAMVYNYGFFDAKNVKLNATITLDNQEIYNETAATVPNIDAGDSIFLSLPTFSQSAYDNGYYHVLYSVESDSVDSYDFDNSATADFAINDDMFSFSTLDENDLSLTHPGGTRANAEIFEACIVFRNPNASRVIATGLSFSAVTSAASELELDGIPIGISVKRWDDFFTDLDDPGVDVSGIVELEQTEFFFDGDPQGEIMYAKFNDAVQLQDNQRYLFCVETFEEELFFGYDRTVDYDYNVSTFYRQPLFPITIDGSQTFLLGFGNDAVPAIGVNLIDAIFLSTEEALKDIKMRAYPSPATSTVTVDFQGHDAASVEVLSLTGQRVHFETVNSGVAETIVDVNSLENGLYLFRVNLRNGSSKTLNVVVSH